MGYDILLINPPLLDVPFVYPGEHLGLGYLAAFMRNEGYTVKIIDAQIRKLDIENTFLRIYDLIKRKDPILIGFSVTQPTFSVTSKIVQKIRKQDIDIPIVVGGKFPTLTHIEILEEERGIDIVVRGDGEFILLDLVQAIEKNAALDTISGITYRNKKGNIKINPPRQLIHDLDSLPFPSRDYLPYLLKSGFLAVNVLSSRGCYWNCKFCTISALNYKWRGRSPENVVEELKYLCDKWHIQLIHFTDSNFIGPGKKGRERAYKIASLIMKEGLDINFSFNCRVNDINRSLIKFLKRAGLVHVFIGTESASQRILDIYNKGTTVKDNINAISQLRDLGINITQGFIMFDPFITLNEIKENVKFLEKTGGWEIDKLVNRLWLTPGTQIVKELESSKMLIKKGLFQYDFKFSDKKVQKLFEIMHLKYYPTIQPILEELQRLKYVCYYQERNSFHLVKTLEDKIKKNAIDLLKECIYIIKNDKLDELHFIWEKEELEISTISHELEKIYHKVMAKN